MGKGDRKTKRGKIYVGSHGNVRARALKKSTTPSKAVSKKPAVKKAASRAKSA